MILDKKKTQDIQKMTQDKTMIYLLSGFHGFEVIIESSILLIINVFAYVNVKAKFKDYIKGC